MLTNFSNLRIAFFLILSNFEIMSFIGKFTKLKKNKEFGYTPRFYDDKGEGSPYKIEHKLDNYRTTAHTIRGLKGKVNNALDDIENKGDSNLKIRLGIIIAVLVFIFLYIIDFDLSIFI